MYILTQDLVSVNLVSHYVYQTTKLEHTTQLDRLPKLLYQLLLALFVKLQSSSSTIGISKCNSTM